MIDRITRLLLAALIVVAMILAGGAPARAQQPDEDRQIADSLAAMLRAGRAVISANQARINDPALGDKGLGGATVLADSIDIYQRATGVDPRKLDTASRQGRLLGDEMAAIQSVMDANQATINAAGAGFKGFIPAVFSRLVSEDFTRRAAGAATMRVTAPPDLVRNRRARPDAWETGVISERFLSADWPKGQSYEAVVDQGGSRIFRIAVPEYYAQSCLSCHGAPKGATDITGYPKEGAALGDLGGVISITLAR